MKNLRTLFVCVMLLCVAQVMAEKVSALTVNPVFIEPGGTGEIVINIDYDAAMPIDGYAFSIMLPEGISPDTKTGKFAKACITLGEAIYPIELEDGDEEEFRANTMSVTKETDGGWLIIWDAGMEYQRTPLKSTHGELIRIRVKADENIGDDLVGKLYDIQLVHGSYSLDMNNIADVEFDFHTGELKPLNGDVNKDGIVDVADIGAIITVMTKNAGKKTALTVDPVFIEPGGTGEIVINIDYDADVPVQGYYFSIMLPEGISANNKSGKLTKACITLGEAIYPIEDEDEEDYRDYTITVKDNAEGGKRIIWIEPEMPHTPLKSTHGELMRIHVIADENLGDNLVGEIYDIVFCSEQSTSSLDRGNIADVEFGFYTGEPKPTSVKGDVNEDGKVDVADIAAIITIMTQ